METYHKVANEMGMNRRQRQMYFRIGAEIQNSRRSGGRYPQDNDTCYGLALAALEAIEWKSMKAAKAILTATGAW